MSLRDNLRTKEEIFKSDYITVAELSLFGSVEEYCWQTDQFEKKEQIGFTRFELLDFNLHD